MNGSPLEKRAERRERNHSSVDLNLVALIDIFTILIFFLLSNMAEVQALPSSKAVSLPLSSAEKAPMETLVVVVNDADLIVDGRRVAAVADVLRSDDEVIAPLKAELDLLAGRRVVQQDKADEARAITIMGDKDIPYRLLRRVMVTCARAGFSDVAFAVQRRDS
ncbi:MAG: biopolymer transporter ExbD [Burkholderiales bacterium]|jgi:biopolymer transport protein ExbD|nr:biopolymer transporter ExbD [Burkholderiales bacterium]